MRRLRGLVDLCFDAVGDTVRLVERTHASVARRSVRRWAPVEPLATPARAVDAAHRRGAAGVYATLRAVHGGVHRLARATAELVADAALGEEAAARLEPPTRLRSDAARSLPWLLDHAEAGLNGLAGHRLARRGSGLDLGMSLRHEGRAVPLEREALACACPEATPKLAVFVHGLACTEWTWSLYAERYHGDPRVHLGARLREELGYTPLFLRYNTGRHVSENGRALSGLLARLVPAFPEPVEEIVLVGHSMGGLVARSAAHQASREGAEWLGRLRHVVCLGSPHLGAPLEKGANLLSGLLRAFDTAATRVPAELLDARSAGIKDLRFGYTVDEEWRGEDPDALLEDRRRDVPPVEGVAYSFLATTVTRDPEHPVGRLLGDLLVRLPSAMGRATRPARRIRFHAGRVLSGVHHLHLANHPAVHAHLREQLGAAPAATARRRLD